MRLVLILIASATLGVGCEYRVVEHAEDAGKGAAGGARSRTRGARARDLAAAVREAEPHGAGAARRGRHRRRPCTPAAAWSSPTARRPPLRRWSCATAGWP